MASKADKQPPILSFSASQRQLLKLMERCGDADVEKILLTTRVDDAERVAGELCLTAAGHPVSVVTRAWSDDDRTLLVHHAGQCVINLKDFKNLVSAMPNDVLDITCAHDRRFVIEAAGHADKPKRRTFTVYALDAEDYPKVAALPKGVSRTLPGKLMRDGIERVRYAAGTVLDAAYSGVLFELKKGSLEIVGASNHVIAVYKADADIADPPEDLLIPGPLLSLVCALGDEETLRFAQDEHRVYVAGSHTVAMSLKNVGAYPLWRTIFERSRASMVKMCELDGLQLAEAVKALSTVWRLSCIGNKNADHGAPVLLELDGNKLRVTTGFEPMGSKLAGSEEEIEVGNPDRRTLKRLFEASFLISGATGVRGIAKLLSDPGEDLSPMILETSDGSFMAVTSPRRLPGQ